MFLSNTLLRPIYLFSHFRVPVFFVNQIISLISKFQWKKGGDKGIYWRSWTKLCRPKTLGELGFRDLGLMNQALFANIAWRMFSNQDSLISKVFLAKYCSNLNLLEVKSLVGCYWGWRSVLWVRICWLKGSNGLWVMGIVSMPFKDFIGDNSIASSLSWQL